MSVIKTSQLMLYREIMALCSQIHTKPTNTPIITNYQLQHVAVIHKTNKSFSIKSVMLC